MHLYTTKRIIYGTNKIHALHIIEINRKRNYFVLAPLKKKKNEGH